MKWVCVATAPNEPIAESWVELLRQHGLPAYAERVSAIRAQLGPSFMPVRVMAPADHEAAAKEVLQIIQPEPTTVEPAAEGSQAEPVTEASQPHRSWGDRLFILSLVLIAFQTAFVLIAGLFGLRALWRALRRKQAPPHPTE